MVLQPFSAELSFLRGGGEMGALIRAHDWALHPLGPPQQWPQSLRTAVRLMLNTGHPMYVFWGPAGICLYNDAYSKSIGPERHPVSLGLPALEVWEEIWPVIGPQIEQVMAGRGATWNENQLIPITRNGRYEEVYWTYSYGPIDDESAANGVGGVLVVCSETTQTVLAERRRIAEAGLLRNSEEQLRLATEAGELGLWDVDLRSNTLFWRARAMLGIPADQPVSMDDFYAGLHPQDRDATRLAFTLAADPGTRAFIDVEYRTVGNADGMVRWVAAKGRGIFEADFCVRLIGTAMDISGRKEAEQRLRDSEAQLRLFDELSIETRSAVAASDILQATARHLGRYLGVQRCAYADMEADENTFTIRDDWVDGVPSSRGVYTLDAFGPRALADLRSGRPLVVRDVDRELAPAEGGDTFNSIAIKAVICYPHVRAGKLLALMAVHQTAPRDWTAAEITLVGGVVERSWAHIERIRSAQKLLEADRRKDEFLATLAHELRNPLAPIRQAARLARAEDATSAQRVWSMGVIERQAAHMALLLDDLLDVSRITRGQLRLRREWAQLTDLIDAAVETASALIDSRHHRLVRDLPAESVALHVDTLRFAQIISNLLTNAAKYTDAGGQIGLRAWREGELLRLSVTDNGIGIAAEMLPRVFDMFAQATTALERSQGGLGIGLALVKGLVDLHGGSIVAYSGGLGRGSRFTVSVPLSTRPARSKVATSTQPATPQASSPRRIVVADDNRDAAMSLALLLEMDGHTVATVFDGVAAVRAAVEFAPDVMCIDIGMPLRNGYEVARQIRELENGGDILLIAVTGWGQAHDQKRAAREGFDRHLTKPVDYEALRALLVAVERPT